MFTILTPIIIFLVSILLINVLQNKSPNILPDFLKDWMFLPEHLRSLEPYDKLIIKRVIPRYNKKSLECYIIILHLI